MTRALIYGNARKLFWVLFVLLLFAEYRFAKWLYPTFNLKEPLSGTGALVMFGVLTASLLVLGNVFIPVMNRFFPYFELEQNLSRSRVASRKLVGSVALGVLAAATFNFLLLVFGPAISRLFETS